MIFLKQTCANIENVVLVFFVNINHKVQMIVKRMQKLFYLYLKLKKLNKGEMGINNVVIYISYI